MSSNITTETVKELRDATGVSVMQCRRALEEAGGDTKKALAILKKTSSEIAEKKMGREAKDGAVAIKASGKRAVLVSLRCETDFVAKNEDFKKLLEDLTETAEKNGIEKMKEGAKEKIDLIVQKTGEKIELGETYEILGETLGSYVHNGKIAVAVSLDGGSAELARDVAMHIAAMKPEYITPEEVTDEAKNTMLEVFQKEVENVNKPEEIKKKMLLGKLSSYFKEKTLLNQPFIKNGDETVGELLAKSKAKIKEVKRYSI